MKGTLNGVRIWISGSMPSDSSQTELENIERYLIAFVSEVFRRGGTVVHGSEPSVSSVILGVAEEYRKITGDRPRLLLTVSRHFLNAQDILASAWLEQAKLNAASIIEVREGAGDDLLNVTEN